MNLAIFGRNALVCGASKGLGRACAFSLAREGATVTMVARGAEALEAAAEKIRRDTGARVMTVPADITTSEGRAAVLAVCGALDTRKTVAHNVTINNLLPGPFETDRLLETARLWSRQSGKSEDVVLAERRASNPAGRFGTPSEFGDACAYFCNAQAGFITGQNLLLDGGNYPGTF